MMSALAKGSTEPAAVDQALSSSSFSSPVSGDKRSNDLSAVQDIGSIREGPTERIFSPRSAAAIALSSIASQAVSHQLMNSKKDQIHSASQSSPELEKINRVLPSPPARNSGSTPKASDQTPPTHGSHLSPGTPVKNAAGISNQSIEIPRSVSKDPPSCRASPSVPPEIRKQQEQYPFIHMPPPGTMGYYSAPVASTEVNGKQEPIRWWPAVPMPPPGLHPPSNGSFAALNTTFISGHTVAMIQPNGPVSVEMVQ